MAAGRRHGARVIAIASWWWMVLNGALRTRVGTERGTGDRRMAASVLNGALGVVTWQGLRRAGQAALALASLTLPQ
eukprot:594753-Rhodomonas_salina.1